MNQCIEEAHSVDKYCQTINSDLSTDTKHIFDKTQNITGSQMLCDQNVITLLKMLIQISGAKNILEIGTFTGFSALNMAEALPDDGQLTTIELAPLSFQKAKENFKHSKLAHKITALLGDAKVIIPTLTGLFDFVFVDADKCAYATYLELILPKLTPNGLIIFDNVLWKGEVIAPIGKKAKVLDAFNRLVAKDCRVQRTLLPVGDGVMILQKLNHS